MRKKILKVIMILILGILAFICFMTLLQTLYMQKRIVDANRETGSKIDSMSSEAMDKLAREILAKTSAERATAANDEFADFIESVSIIANAARAMYLNPELYGKASLGTYGDAERGKIVTYAAFGEGADPGSQDIQDEVAMLANMQATLKAVNETTLSMSADYFASESGIFLCAEKASDYNIPKKDEPLSFEAHARPWYQKAVETGVPVFTGIIDDSDTGKPVITCGVPVYANGVLRGVAGAGLYLDTIRSNVKGYKIGKNGFACVINSEGQVLFSGAESGELAVNGDAREDLRKSRDGGLAAFIKEGLEGKSEVRTIELDGKEYYAACAPMNSVGWTYIAVLPKEEVTSPTYELLSEVNISKEEQDKMVRAAVLSSIGLFLILLVITGLVVSIISIRLADKLAEPVVRLTNNVRNIDGDNLDFSWDMDTHDEVQTLAESFGSMTDRMKQYIQDITVITAEKERIGAELSVAANIQASMLPSDFPPFPDRKEFEIYAKMTPAKEVGGDFYDFFFVDDNRLAIVMADVSGKGVPAALFMVVAKTLIKNFAITGMSVDEVLRTTNDRLCEGNAQEMFVTAWLGIIDLEIGRLSYSDAGHENPYIIHDDGSVEMIMPSRKKLPLAAMEGTAYPVNEMKLTVNDMLFLYTDGVPEATNSKNELYTTDRLERVLKRNYRENPEGLLVNVRKNVDAFVRNAPQFDDLTMLALRIKSLT